MMSIISGQYLYQLRVRADQPIAPVSRGQFYCFLCPRGNNVSTSIGLATYMKTLNKFKTDNVIRNQTTCIYVICFD